MDDGKSNPVPAEKPEKSVFAKKLRIRKEFLKTHSRSGGRCLDAIWDRTDLTTGERAVLQQIAAFHDYRSDTFVGPVKLSQRLIQDRCNMSADGVRKALKSLEEKKLITVTRYKGGKGQAASENEYRLTGKLFRDFVESRVIPRFRADWIAESAKIPPDSVGRVKTPTKVIRPKVSQNPPRLSREGEITHASESADSCQDDPKIEGKDVAKLSCGEIPPDSVGGPPLLSRGLLIPKEVPKEELNLNPPISPPSGDSVKGRGVKRAHQANCRKLFLLCTNAYGHWRAMYDRTNRGWIEGLGLGTPDEILGQAYPKLVTDLMGIFGPSWFKGTGRQARDPSKPDWDHWFPKIHTELLRVRGYERLVDVEECAGFATLDSLILHAQKRAEISPLDQSLQQL